MSRGGPNDPSQVIIVRRNSIGDSEGHKGGVWKIAFADFMTAMMAFFLVLWIVSSSTKETRVALARYFNPIRLVDASVRAKGLESTGIAREQATGGNTYDDGGIIVPEESRVAPGHSPDDKIAALKAIVEGMRINPDAPGSRRDDSPERPETPAVVPAEANPPLQDKKTGASQNGAGDLESVKSGAPSVRNNVDVALNATAEELSTVMNALEADLIGRRDVRHLPMVRIDRHPTELRISMSDDAKFEMFAIGSSSPNERTIAYLNAIGATLKKHSGSVIVAGHTDGRKYRDRHRDNWKLSGDRARAAAKILSNVGLEKSIFKLEAYADSKPQMKDINAPENRRIEIVFSPN